MPVHHATSTRAIFGGHKRLPGSLGVGFAPERFDAPTRAALLTLAHATGAATWPIDGDIANARNAHRTNTAAELQAALAGDFDWLEGDVRMRGGEAVLAHGAPDGDALPLAEWLAVGQASKRGLKLDFKDARALEPARRLVQQAGIAEERLILNVAIAGPGRAHVSAGELRALRTAFPKAILNLDPGPAPYDDAAIARAVRVARELGGRVMFPIEAQHASARVIRGLRKGGRVAIWNDPRKSDCGDIGAATKRFRAMGANGMIDLRRFAPTGR